MLFREGISLRSSTIFAMTQLRLYDYVASANCYKVRLLLSQLQLEYERVAVDIFNGDTLTDTYTQINPLRSTPVLEIAPQKYLIESNAILVYLAQGTNLLPDGAIEQSEITRWLIYEQTDVMPAIGGLRFRLYTKRFTAEHPDAVARKAAGEEILDLLDTHLQQRQFLVEDQYSIADIAVYGYTHVAGEAGYEMSRWPEVQRWLDTITQQPNYLNDLTPYPPNAMVAVGQSIYG